MKMLASFCKRIGVGVLPIMACMAIAGCEPAPNQETTATTAVEEDRSICGGNLPHEKPQPVNVHADCNPDAAQSWPNTILLHGHRGNGETAEVAKITLQAAWNTTPISPGNLIITDTSTSPPTVNLSGNEYGYIKLRISKIDWSPCKECDGSPKYQIIQRNLWIDMAPKPWAMDNSDESEGFKRKRFITAPNVAFQNGDSLPPPVIFKVNQNTCYTFTLGLHAVTPFTVDENPEMFEFYFEVMGLTQ